MKKWENTLRTLGFMALFGATYGLMELLYRLLDHRVAIVVVLAIIVLGAVAQDLVASRKAGRK